MNDKPDCEFCGHEFDGHYPDCKSRFSELERAAIELAEYASYSEITGGININRPQIRELCDRIFELNKT